MPRRLRHSVPPVTFRHFDNIVGLAGRHPMQSKALAVVVLLVQGTVHFGRQLVTPMTL